VCVNRWALNNPHISVHIPTSSRLTVSTQTKRNGQPRRPSKSLASVVSNVHLLLRVPSFARWPLRVHFFNRDAFAAWEKWCATVSEGLRGNLRVVTDFGPPAPPQQQFGQRDGEQETVGTTTTEGEEVGQPAPAPWGIHALPLDYEPIKEYVAKGQDIFEFERQGRCVVCREEMPTGEGLHALCTNEGCDGVGHVSCWSRHFLKGDEEDSIVPVQGQCPKCKGEVHWGDMMRELTLRVRAPKDVEKLLKLKRKRKRATKAVKP
jgi:structure-specific endonuclease subunit SLX1